MTDIKALLERYDTWNKERSALGIADGTDDSPSSSQWQANDDEAFNLLELLAIALQEKREVWSALVTRPTGPPVVSLHDSEEQAIESIEERFSDEVEREDDIVTDLETWGYTVTIDSHEI